MTAFALAAFTAGTVEAQKPSCPPELAQAKEQLRLLTAKSDETRAPRALAGKRSVQAPRGQDVQAPRGQDIQAPRGQDVQAPRSPGAPKADSSKASKLVKEAEAACAKGDMATSKAKAQAALTEMKK